MQEDELLKTAIKTAEIVQELGRQAQQQTQQVQQATQQINQVSQNVHTTSERVTHEALEQFRATAKDVLENGLSAPINECEKTLQAAAYKIELTADKLDKRMDSMTKMHTAHTWKVVVASALAICSAIGVSTYAIKSSHTEMVRADLTRKINTAIQKGNLVSCEDDGICARNKNQLIRLDK
jgi:hypothetical protein